MNWQDFLIKYVYCPGLQVVAQLKDGREMKLETPKLMKTKLFNYYWLDHKGIEVKYKDIKYIEVT
jgi:hypothetical protein